MTDAELKAAETQSYDLAADADCALAKTRELVAEIRRLRGLVALAEDCGHCCNHCAFCGNGYGNDRWDDARDKPRHAAECPAFEPDGRVK